MSRLAEQGGMLEDMADHIFDLIRAKDVHKVRFNKHAAAVDADYTWKEKNTIHVGLKNSIGQKRLALRTVIQIKENSKYTRYTKALEAYI